MQRIVIRILFLTLFFVSTNETNWACTIITVGKKASTDGATYNVNASDSRTTRTWLNVVPSQKHSPDAVCPIFGNSKRTLRPTNLSAAKKLGEIPQVAVTSGYLNTGYPCMNEHQLTVTETTFGGPDTLRNPAALFACEELCRIIMERCRTAREAIALIDELTRKYGYNDAGEVLAIADKKEVWYLEIIGCGRHQIGAVWAAQRVPNDHIAVSANGSRILEIDVNNPDKYLASKNVFQVAEAMGWWSPQSGEPFRFAYIYGKKSRRSMATRRREWRVFNLVAPSLDLDPNASDFPFSVKPDTLVNIRQMMDILADTFEGTPFDMTKNIRVTAKDGQSVKSPYANPFMHYDMMPLFNINGGWNELGERCIARYYCNYSVICQIRDWLPDFIGGVVWHGFDNPATTVHIPLFIGITQLPAAYHVNGRSGFNRDCAWWAFNRVADLAAQKWGVMRLDVDSVRTMFKKQLFTEFSSTEQQALKRVQPDQTQTREILTQFSCHQAEAAVKKWWELGDFLWSKYTGKF